MMSVIITEEGNEICSLHVGESFAEFTSPDGIGIDSSGGALEPTKRVKKVYKSKTHEILDLVENELIPKLRESLRE